MQKSGLMDMQAVMCMRIVHIMLALETMVAHYIQTWALLIEGLSHQIHLILHVFMVSNFTFLVFFPIKEGCPCDVHTCSECRCMQVKNMTYSLYVCCLTGLISVALSGLWVDSGVEFISGVETSVRLILRCCYKNDGGREDLKVNVGFLSLRVGGPHSLYSQGFSFGKAGSCYL
jgi:hypothetical protein